MIRRVGVGIFIACFIGLLVFYAAQSIRHVVPKLIAIGAQIPELNLVPEESEALDIDVHQHAKRIMLFSSPTCDKCKNEFENITRIRLEHPEYESVSWILVNTSATEKFSYSTDGWELYLDPEGKTRLGLGAIMVPFILFIDENEIVQYRRSGTAPFEQNVRVFARLLNAEI